VQVELQVSAPHEIGVYSDCLPIADSLAKSLDVSTSVAATHVRDSHHTPRFPHVHHYPSTGKIKGILTNTQYDITSKPPECDTMSHHSIVEDVNVGAESQSTFLPAMEDKVQGSSKVTADLDYLDGSTIIAEVRQSLCITFAY
jgi:hypothetical protein